MANNGMPSLLALLGLVAVAGFQNRDKIGQVLGQSGLGQSTNPDGSSPATNYGGALNDAGNVVGRTASDVGGSLMNGLNDLMSTFRNAGQKEQADSWITPGVPTQGLSRDQVESAIGRETLTEVAHKSGINYDELLQRLATAIPDAVDRATPDGRFPSSDAEVQDRVLGSIKS